MSEPAPTEGLETELTEALQPAPIEARTVEVELVGINNTDFVFSPHGAPNIIFFESEGTEVVTHPQAITGKSIYSEAGTVKGTVGEGKNLLACVMYDVPGQCDASKTILVVIAGTLEKDDELRVLALGDIIPRDTVLDIDFFESMKKETGKTLRSRVYLPLAEGEPVIELAFDVQRGNYGRKAVNITISERESLQKALTHEAKQKLHSHLQREVQQRIVQQEPKPGMDHYEISTDFKGQAVHESITIAALLHSKKYPLSWETHAGNMTWLMDRDTFEFVRGIFWNDDPACELFNDDRDPESNRNTATGLVWYQRFSREDPRDIITRSHHGDLQFLHAMATELGQDPNVTRQLCLDWAKLMYELAVGAVSEWTLLQDTYLKKSFHNGTSPPGSIPLRELLLQGNASNYNWVKIDRRALGTVMHMIQDSYSRGHCQREILNPQNIDYGTSFLGFFGYHRNILKFQDNQPGRFGAIENFHYYHGQSDDHSSYDVKPQQFGSMAIVPKNLSTFDDIIGARDSIDQCTKLVAFWCDKVQWEDGPRQLLEEIFTLSQHATPSNTNV